MHFSLFTTELAAIEHLHARERAARRHAARRPSTRRRAAAVLASWTRPSGDASS
jgi:hypothetical protein